MIRGNLAVETLEVVPDPVSLMESMRAVGYTAESAIADLIDNCISAQAKNVFVEYDAVGQPFVAILDDGCGMDASQLTQAMRHGSRNPADSREPSDLGRFGLGLKTASLSQCRKLTVISKRAGVTSARRWDLDVVQASGRWLVVVPDARDLGLIPMFARLAAMESGTLVVWQDLDRFAAGSTDLIGEMTTKFAGLLEHLALVFHRFTGREEDYPAISIRVNGLALPARDPFLRANTYRQPMEGQSFRRQGGVVRIAPYILPPISHLSQAEIELAGGREGLRGTQGFYVYRNRRLVIWGTWFHLVPKQEFFKLTRIQVDIPNTFDELWALDIKKSAAQPPDFIRARLRELIPHFADASKKTITYPGRKTNAGKYAPVWSRIESQHGLFRYEINPEHPAIQLFSACLDNAQRMQLDAVLDLVSAGIPLEGIYADMCSDRRSVDDDTYLASLIELASKLRGATGLTVEEVLDLDPFVRSPGLRRRILEELQP